MLNKELLNKKYKTFIPEEPYLDSFIKEIEWTKGRLNDVISSKGIKPLFLYSDKNNNPVYYLLSVNYSLKAGKVLDYLNVRGQTFIREHFADKERDQALYEGIYYTDILYITITQAEYTSEYMESLLQDLIDFRNNRSTATVIIYEVLNKTDKSYMGYTKSLRDFFTFNNYFVADLTTDITAPHSESKAPNVAKRKGRII